MTAARWERLAASLAAAGVDAQVTEQPYPGGVSRSILLRHSDVLIWVTDWWWRKNDAVWIGWVVYVDDVATSIELRRWAATKRRSEVVANVQTALAEPRSRRSRPK